MHPIEYLRYVARATGADPVSLVHETSQAIRGLRHEPAGLVLTARRIIERHPTCGPLWWLCAQVLIAGDPFDRAAELSRELDDDRTTEHLVDALPSDARVCAVGWSPTVLEALARRGDCSALIIDSFGTADSAVRALERAGCSAQVVAIEHAAVAVQASDLVVIDALACGSETILASAGSHGVAALAYCEQLPVWLTARRGTRMPAELWQAMHARNRDAEQPWRTETDMIPVEMVGTFVGPAGVSHVAADALRPECAATTEMLVRSAM
jgi:hypothetical protein